MQPPAADRANRPFLWMALAIGVMFVISFFRWITSFRRSLAARSKPPLFFDRPTEEISPEDLASYLENVEESDDSPPPDRAEPPPGRSPA